MAAAAILKNLNIFATDWQILTIFGILMRLYPMDPLADKISRFQKSKMAAAAIWKIEKSQYLCFG